MTPPCSRGRRPRCIDESSADQSFDVFDGLDKVCAWRAALAQWPSVQEAVGANYAARLQRFLLDRRSHLSVLMDGAAATVACA
jgi:glutathione S-transferase